MNKKSFADIMKSAGIGQGIAITTNHFAYSATQQYQAFAARVKVDHFLAKGLIQIVSKDTEKDLVVLAKTPLCTDADCDAFSEGFSGIVLKAEVRFMPEYTFTFERADKGCTLKVVGGNQQFREMIRMFLPSSKIAFFFESEATVSSDKNGILVLDLSGGSDVQALIFARELARVFRTDLLGVCANIFPVASLELSGNTGAWWITVKYNAFFIARMMEYKEQGDDFVMTKYGATLLLKVEDDVALALAEQIANEFGLDLQLI